MNRFLFGLVKWLGVMKLTLEFLNELFTFIEKVLSYIHVAPYYIFKSRKISNGSMEA